MANTTILLSGSAEYEKSRKYLEYPADYQRFLFHTGRIYKFHVFKTIETETSMYWIEDTYTPRFTNKLFYTSKALTGISFDKKTKDVKIWFGKYPPEFLILSFYSYFNVNQLEITSNSFRRYFTKSLAKDIAKGKIQNVDDYALFLSKRTMFFRGLDPKQLARFMYHEIMHESTGMDISYLSNVFNTCKDLEKTIDCLIEGGLENYNWALGDLSKRAMSLGEKIDCSSKASILAEKERIDNLTNVYRKKYTLEEPSDFPF